MNFKTFLLLVIILIGVPLAAAVYNTYRHSSFTIGDGKDIDLNGQSIGNGTFVGISGTISSIQNESFTYLIFKNGTGYFAKNGTTGTIDYSGSVASTVVNSAIANSGIIIFMPGNYSITQTLNVKSNTIIRGSGQNTIFYISTGMNDLLINVTNVSNVVLSDFTLLGNSAGQSVSPAGEIGFTDSKNIYISNLNISDMYASAISFGTTNSSKTDQKKTVINSRFNNIGQVASGAGVYAQGKDNIIMNNYFNKTTDNAIGLDDASDSIISGNIVENGAYLILLSSTVTSKSIYNIIIQNNYVRNSNRPIFLGSNNPPVQNIHDIIITGNKIYNNVNSGISVIGGNKIIVSNNIVSNDSSEHGIYLSNVTDSLISSNNINNNVLNGIHGINLSRNIISNNLIVDNNYNNPGSGGGIYMLNSTNNSVFDNMIYDTHTPSNLFIALYEEGSRSNFNVLVNNFLGNATYSGGKIFSTGADTTKTPNYNI